MTYISSGKERCVLLGNYLVENQTTVRATANRFGISKSTVHKDVTQVLRKVNYPLYRGTMSGTFVVSVRNPQMIGSSCIFGSKRLKQSFSTPYLIQNLHFVS